MDGLKILRERLIALAAPPQPLIGGARPLAMSQDRDARAAFETEIGQTRLPRRLTFSNSRDAQFVLTAASGRLVSIDQMTPQDSADPTLPITLNAQDPDSVARASLLVSRFLEGTSSLSVSAAMPSTPPVGVGLGVSASLLTAPPEKSPAHPQEFDAFMTLLQPHSAAWVVLRAGNIAELQGSKAQKAKLTQLAEGMDAAEHGDAAGLHCVMLTPHRSPEVIVCASEADDLAFAMIAQEELPQLLQNWQSRRPAG
ncbi:MAG: hypothetical protein AAF340_01335 [Pseudomonadota bacterium]